MNESNDPTEKFDASECFVEAAANLRVAEKLSSNRDYDIGVVNVVVDIAKAWTRLGVALDNRQGWAGATPIPIRLVGDEDPQAAPHDHEWNPFSSVCQVSGCGLTREQRTDAAKSAPLLAHSWNHAWNEDTGFCDNERCTAHQGDRLSDVCPSKPAPRAPVKHVHSTACHHSWVRPTEPCANGCGTGTREKPGYCPKTCPDATA